MGITMNISEIINAQLKSLLKGYTMEFTAFLKVLDEQELRIDVHKSLLTNKEKQLIRNNFILRELSINLTEYALQKCFEEY